MVKRGNLFFGFLFALTRGLRLLVCSGFRIRCFFVVMLNSIKKNLIVTGKSAVLLPK